MMPASCISRRNSRAPYPATTSGSKPSNAFRKFSRLTSIVSHDSPAWLISRARRSSSAASERIGKPYSRSWYGPCQGWPWEMRQ